MYPWQKHVVWMKGQMSQPEWHHCIRQNKALNRPRPPTWKQDANAKAQTRQSTTTTTEKKTGHQSDAPFTVTTDKRWDTRPRPHWCHTSPTPARQWQDNNINLISESHSRQKTRRKWKQSRGWLRWKCDLSNRTMNKKLWGWFVMFSSLLALILPDTDYTVGMRMCHYGEVGFMSSSSWVMHRVFQGL